MKIFASLIGLVAALCLAAPAARSQSFTDEMGRSVVLAQAPRRIIALTPALTEILFALGLGDRTVGATTWADFPDAAKALPRVGSYVSPNLEKIIELAPDLVLASKQSSPPWAVERLERIGIPVYVVAPHDPLGLPASIIELGRVCGAPAKGRELAAEIQGQFEAVTKLVAGANRPRTLLVIGSNPLISAGRGSISDVLLTMAGADNIAAAAPGVWPKLSMEMVIEKQPEVVIISTMDRGMELDKVMEQWRAMPGLRENPALRVVGIDSSIIDRAGPRLGLGLETLAALVHPELFGGGR